MSQVVQVFRYAKEFENYAAGEIIFEAGTIGDKMYSIVEGEVEILLGNEVVESLGPDDIFGELSLIEPGPRTGTARAKTKVRVVPIDKKRFEFLVQQIPNFALHVMKVLTNRLRDIDAKYSDHK